MKIVQIAKGANSNRTYTIILNKIIQ